MYKKILLIDDDEDEQFFFLEALKELDSPVKFFFASSANEGFKMFDYVSPDIVFIDINMPMINGLEWLDTIKHNGSNQEFNAIIYSTGVDNSLCDRAIKKGAFACIKKQGGIHDLVNVLKTLL
jgi:CheY-like chemotaxis protein